MKRDALASLALQVADALPAAEQSQPFGEETEVFKVVGKIFALVDTAGGEAVVTLKCAPPHARSLVETHASIVPGYHMNKQHWISLRAGGDLDRVLVEDLIGNSYDIVVALLPRYRRPLDTGRRGAGAAGAASAGAVS